MHTTDIVEAIRRYLAIDVLAFGHFAPGQVHITWNDQPRPTTPEIEAAIDRTWPEQLDRARQEGRKLFNGTMARYIEHRQDEADLHLLTGPTCYRDFIGTNLYNPALIDSFDWRHFSNPLGTTATIISADGFLLYGRRNNSVAFHAGYVHTFGGALEPADRVGQDSVDGFGGILRELHEELALEPQDVEELICVGLIRDRQIWQPELLFEARCRYTRQEILAQLSGAADQEHSAIECCPDHSMSLIDFMTHTHPIAPVALGSILLHGWAKWGAPWVLQAAQQVAENKHT